MYQQLLQAKVRLLQGAKERYPQVLSRLIQGSKDKYSTYLSPPQSKAFLHHATDGFKTVFGYSLLCAE
jgi:hypothetical protein